MWQTNRTETWHVFSDWLLPSGWFLMTLAVVLVELFVLVPFTSYLDRLGSREAS